MTADRRLAKVVAADVVGNPRLMGKNEPERSRSAEGLRAVHPITLGATTAILRPQQVMGLGLRTKRWRSVSERRIYRDVVK